MYVRTYVHRYESFSTREGYVISHYGQEKIAYFLLLAVHKTVAAWHYLIIEMGAHAKRALLPRFNDKAVYAR